MVTLFKNDLNYYLLNNKYNKLNLRNANNI